MLGDKRLRTTIDDALRKGTTTLQKLQQAATTRRSLVGARRLLQLISDGTFDQESEGERVLAGLFGPTHPQPQWQVWVLPDVRADCAYCEARLIIEYDSRAHHVLPTDRDRDSARDLQLAEAGILTIRVTAAMLAVAHRAETLARILRVRDQRLADGVVPLVPLEPPTWASQRTT